MTRVLYCGNFTYPYCTEVHIAWSLERIGIPVIRIQEDRHTPELIEKLAVQNDVAAVWYTMTPPGLPERTTGVWQRLEDRGIRTVSYHLDLYVGLKREATLIDGDPFWTTGTIFTPDGDPASADLFAHYGIRHRWQPPAVVEYEAYRGTPCARFTHDVVFVGSEHYHDEWPHRAKLIGWLRDTYGERFHRYGVRSEVVRGPHLNDLYATAKIVVGDSLCPGYTKPGYWSDRAYETLGRGGFLIHPRVPGLDAHFTDREHLVYYDYEDWDGLRNVIDYYLAHDDERHAIQAAGHAHVVAHHTYTHRVRDTLAVLWRDADLEAVK